MTRFDSSIGRGDIITPIGVGRVIRGPFLTLATHQSNYTGIHTPREVLDAKRTWANATA
jgi:hypothetical protein